MCKIKVIPCLDIMNNRVVKGVKFENMVDACDPVEAAKAYCAQGADELAFLDITATVEDRSTRLAWVKNVVDVCTVPVCVGGGVRSLEDYKNLFDLGVGKVSINSAGIADSALIEQAAKQFGSERVVVAIDGKKSGDGWNVVVSGGKEDSGVDAVEWAKKVEGLGAGEILLTSLDADGMKTGYDLELTKAVVDAVSLPVTASGGAGTLEHFVEAAEIGCKAVLAASLFHFKELEIKDVKLALIKAGFETRVVW